MILSVRFTSASSRDKAFLARPKVVPRVKIGLQTTFDSLNFPRIKQVMTLLICDVKTLQTL